MHNDLVPNTSGYITASHREKAKNSSPRLTGSRLLRNDGSDYYETMKNAGYDIDLYREVYKKALKEVDRLIALESWNSCGRLEEMTAVVVDALVLSGGVLGSRKDAEEVMGLSRTQYFSLWRPRLSGLVGSLKENTSWLFD